MTIRELAQSVRERRRNMFRVGAETHRRGVLLRAQGSCKASNAEQVLRNLTRNAKATTRPQKWFNHAMNHTNLDEPTRCSARRERGIRARGQGGIGGRALAGEELR